MQDQKRSKKKKLGIVLSVVLFVIILLLLTYIFEPFSFIKYLKGLYNENRGNYMVAEAYYSQTPDFLDSDEHLDYVQRELNYASAVEKMKLGEYKDAAALFAQAKGLKDSAELGAACSYKVGTDYERSGDYTNMLTYLWAAGDYKDALDITGDYLRRINCHVVDADWYNTFAVTDEGRVLVAGGNAEGQASVEDWEDIVSISGHESFTIGLKSDGSICYTPPLDGNNDIWNYSDKFDTVFSNNNIVDITNSGYHVVGLKSDGTVVGAGPNTAAYIDSNSWSDIIAVDTGIEHTVGLKNDGTVVAAGNNKNQLGEEAGQCNVKSWTDIVAISAGNYHTVGLKSDGTVIATGLNDVIAFEDGNEDPLRGYAGQCDVEGWTDIVAIATGSFHTIGLKSDGTVVATGDNYFGQCNISTWKDIIAVYAGEWTTIGLKEDGTIRITGLNLEGSRNVSGFSNIQMPGSY